MDFLKKLRVLPEKNKKIILWTIVIVIALVLFFFWFRNLGDKLANFKTGEFKEKLNLPEPGMPEFEMPAFEIPDIYGQEEKQQE